MLSPEYYEGCADDILKLYEQLEDDIISDVVRRIMQTGKVTATARHQIEQLQETGLLYDDILEIVANQTDATNQQVRALFEDAGVETVRFDNRIYRENGLVPVDIRQSPAMRRTLEAGYRKTLGDMKNLTLTTAVTSQTAYINACNLAYMEITSGAFSYQEAVKQAIQKTAQNGATVLYPSGHTERIDVAVRRAVLTGVGQTCREIGRMNAEECGCDLMEISAHSGARPDHAAWQGKIVSLSGRRGYLSLNDIGYGTGDGFGGWNCRHDWFPFFEGYSKPNYSAEDLKKLDERNIKYNGKLYNQYEISQIQRRYEREIRAAKREQAAFRTAVEEADDPELKQIMQDSLNYSNSLVKDRQAKMRDFIKQTGQDRDYFREQNYAGENPRNNLTFSLNGGKINSRKSDNIDFSIKPLSENAKEFQITYMEQYSKKYPKYTEALTYRFNNGSKRMQNLFLDYVRLDSVADESFVGRNSYFDSNTKRIYMNFTLDFIQNGKGKGVGTVYFHEHGHLIDKALGDISIKNPEFFRQLNMDYINFRKHIDDGKMTSKEVYKFASEQLQNLRTDCGVSDIINGLSYGLIKGCGYHEKKDDGSNYWNDRTICQEAFANMFDAQFDEQKYQRMKSVFPNALQEFERMLEDYCE